MKPQVILQHRTRAAREIADRLLARTREICEERGTEMRSHQIEALAQAVAEELIR